MGRDEVLSPVVHDYGEIVEKLRGLDGVVLRFDDGAQKYRAELEKRHLWLTGLEMLNPKLATHIGKYDGIFARLCVIWHCVENWQAQQLPPLVSEATARRAGEFLHKFLLRHAIAFYAGMLGLSNDHDAVAATAGYILARKLKAITPRDIMRGDRAMRALDSDEIASLLDRLTMLGWLQLGSSPAGAKSWVVNPAVHQKFADRAKAEAKRREDGRKMVAEALGRKEETEE
jgi:hypothetical protein